MSARALAVGRWVNGLCRPEEGISGAKPWRYTSAARMPSRRGLAARASGCKVEQTRTLEVSRLALAKDKLR